MPPHNIDDASAIAPIIPSVASITAVEIVGFVDSISVSRGGAVGGEYDDDDMTSSRLA